MSILHIISIVIEIAVILLGVLIAIIKEKSYGWLIALTFAIYAFYDIAKFGPLNVSQNILYVIFLIASLSILFAVWKIFNE
ncbi:MAG: hypothetical protein NT030_01605 [Candidatus Saganbacteria bacterium]|nr:hypothetical protein [Candidatus Saganbacteria bacterium]